MKGQRRPLQGPSESQAQINAMTMKIPLVGRGTDKWLVWCNKSRVDGEFLTIVDLGDCEGSSGYGRRVSVEALQPVSHRGLQASVVPNNVYKWQRPRVPAFGDTKNLCF